MQFLLPLPQTLVSVPSVPPGKARRKGDRTFLVTRPFLKDTASPSSTGPLDLQTSSDQEAGWGSAAFCHCDSSQASCHGRNAGVLLPRFTRGNPDPQRTSIWRQALGGLWGWMRVGLV